MEVKLNVRGEKKRNQINVKNGLIALLINFLASSFLKIGFSSRKVLKKPVLRNKRTIKCLFACFNAFLILYFVSPNLRY